MRNLITTVFYTPGKSSKRRAVFVVTFVACLYFGVVVPVNAQSRPRIYAPPPLPEPSPSPTPAKTDVLASKFSTAPADVAKAEDILRRAAQALGGAAYLNARTQVSTGRFTTFAGGAQSLPLQFNDTVVFPDKQHTEFRGAGNRLIQVNTASGGWILDFLNRTVRDLKPEQIADFKLGLRASVDNLLRGEWRTEGEMKARLGYVGRRESRTLGRRTEVVCLIYADGQRFDFEFTEDSFLPEKVIYKRLIRDSERLNTDYNPGVVPYDEKTRRAAEEAARTHTLEEVTFARYLDSSNIFAPYIVDNFRDGKQTSRVNFETITFNAPVDNTIFTRPTNAVEFLKKKK